MALLIWDKVHDYCYAYVDLHDYETFPLVLVLSRLVPFQYKSGIDNYDEYVYYSLLEEETIKVLEAIALGKGKCYVY